MIGTITQQTLRESANRRVALALMVVAVLVAVFQFSTAHFIHRPDGKLMVVRMNTTLAPEQFVQDQFHMGMQIMTGLWVMLCLFGAAPLLTSYMEKGWVEMLLSKGVHRWQLFAGRLLGSMGLFIISVAIMTALPNLYFGLRAGVSLRAYWVAMLMVFLSYLSSLALLALLSTSQPNTGLLVLVTFLEYIVTSVLAQRDQLLKLLSWPWVRWVLKWLYRILPKHEEINAQAARYLATGWNVSAWFPLWTTAAFATVCLTWAFWRFQRKAF